MEELLHLIVEFVKQFGYFGIFIMTFVESTFLPVPSEITMIPAGYLVHQGHMHAAWVLLASITGTIGGSWFNYWLAKHYGRRLFLRFGKYFFMTDEKLKKIEDYFRDHGPISIFTGRLIPGIRHYISFPAGLAEMNLRKFIIYTGLGGGIWMATLTFLGYHIGENEDLLRQYILPIKLGIVLVVAILAVGYIWRHRRKQRNLTSQ